MLSPYLFSGFIATNSSERFLIVFNLNVADFLVGLAETVFVGFKNDSKPYAKIFKSFLVIFSGASFCIFSRAYFTGTILRFESPLTTSRNKHQGLDPRYCHRLVGWNSSGCTEITTDFRDLRLEILRCRLLCRRCSVFTLDLLFLSFDPKTFLQEKSGFGYGILQKKCGTKHKTVQDPFYCNGCICCTLGSKHGIVQLESFVRGFIPWLCEYIFCMFHLTNYLINPIIYSLRMPLFKNILQQLKIS